MDSTKRIWIHRYARRKMVLHLSALLALCCILATPAVAQEQVLVEFGSSMSYLANDLDPGTGMGWVAAGFDDSSWLSGNYGVGYEIDTPGGAEALLQTTVPGTTVSIFTRAEFQIPDITVVDSLIFGADYDDGVVAWINGVEVYRSASMPAGALAWDSLPEVYESSNGSTPEYELESITATGLPLLVNGTNLLSVAVWNRPPASSDLVLVPQLITNREAFLTRGPYLQSGSEDSISIRWRTDTPIDSKVFYGASPGNLTTEVATTALTTEHEIRIDNLSPDTTYYYAVGNASELLAGDDADHFFVTAPTTGSSKPTRVWILGDSGTGNSSAQAVRDAYYAETGSTHTDLWLMLGDNAYPNGTDSEYQTKVFDFYPEMLRKSVLWPALGNHETFVNSSNQTGDYFDIFTLPTGGEAGGVASSTEAYYSFDYGNIHFIVLDSFLTPRFIGQPMMNWLEADLAATTQEWIVAYWHHPPYSRGSHDSDNPGGNDSPLLQMRDNAVRLLDDWGADLTFTGHSHSYERSFLIEGHYGDSTTFLESMKVDGGSGREGAGEDGAYIKLEDDPEPHAHSGIVHTVAGSSGQSLPVGTHPAIYTQYSEVGSVILEIDGDRLDARFLNGAGAVQDYFTVIKGCDDVDGDEICDSADNCVNDSNTDQLDTDGDGAGDACDPDDDGDGVEDSADGAPLDPHACRDTDGDTCDDCSTGVDDSTDDGSDFDDDGQCDLGDADDDNDGILDGVDSDPLDPFACRDVDGDSCDDCSSGTDDVLTDGPDFDQDGQCDAGDPDDDNDGVADESDTDPFNAGICADVDGDSCEDCKSGSFAPSADGSDFDADGLCDAGDADDDNDGVEDGEDSDPLDPAACRDADLDTCDDCAVGAVGLIDAGFVVDAEGWTYVDDAFRGTSEASYADGRYSAFDGFDGGGLAVDLGGLDDIDILDMSGGWERTFVLAQAREVTISFRYKLSQLPNYEIDESSEMLLSVDGVLLGQAPDDYLARISGDGNGGLEVTTGWQLFQANLGTLPAGAHSVVIGGYNDKKTLDDEVTTALIDDVLIQAVGGGSGADPLSDGPDADADGLCDAGDADDDNDGVDDPDDQEPLNPLACRDLDLDGCDDCFGGTADPANDGGDVDADGLCDSGDPDADGDAVDNVADWDSLNPNACRDADLDGCDDCVSGSDDPAADGSDFDADGLCDLGDPDDDNDGVIDGADLAPLDPYLCADADGDSCDDCSGNVVALVNAAFSIDAEGFSYADDVFRDTGAPAYASGSHQTTGGSPAGALRVDLGGLDFLPIYGMSGAWELTVTLPATSELSISFDYLLEQSPEYESDEISQVLLEVDGVLYGNAAEDYVDQVVGDGAGGLPVSTGWQTHELSLGSLPAGPHSILVGAYNNKKTQSNEFSELRIDNVVVVGGSGGGFPNPAGDGPDADGDGLCDVGDPDVDGDNVPNGDDAAPGDPTSCRDLDGDGCDDCASGLDAPQNDGTDTDGDGSCDAGDVDDDNDGVADIDDCRPLVVGVSRTPEPVEDLVAEDQGGTTVLRWERGSQGHAANLYRGARAAGEPWAHDVTCLESGNPATVSQSPDASAIPSGTLVFYLVSSVNACGESAMGQSEGSPIQPGTPCSVATADFDSDGVPDLEDNCPLTENSSQLDGDLDFIGDLCDDEP